MKIPQPFNTNGTLSSLYNTKKVFVLRLFAVYAARGDYLIVLIGILFAFRQKEATSMIKKHDFL